MILGGGEKKENQAHRFPRSFSLDHVTSIDADVESTARNGMYPIGRAST